MPPSPYPWAVPKKFILNRVKITKKSFKSIIKLTLIGKLNRIKTNQAQYDLDRETAKISALPPKEVDKYEYLTGEDLGNKPGVVEKAKSEYYPIKLVSAIFHYF